MSGTYDLGTYGAEIVIDDTRFTQSMQNTESQMNNVDNKAGSFGKNLGTLAMGAVAGLGVALVGAGVAGVKMASDLDSSLRQLQSATGATDEEMKGMETSLKNIYSSGYGESFDDIANAMATVKQNTGLAGKELESVTKNAIAVRDTFDMDVTESTRTAKAMMEQFGISSDDAFNLIAQGAQNGANKNGDLLDSLNEYAPQFKSMGFSAEQFTNVLIDGAKNGQFSIDKVGDAMKEFNIRAKDGSKTSAEGFQLLGLNAEEMTSKFAQGGDSAQQAFKQVITALNGIEDPVQKNTAGVALFGTQFEDLEAQGIAAFANIGNTASLSKDAMGKINEVKYDSLGAALQGILRSLQVSLIEPIQQHVLPLFNEFAQWIQAHMPQIQATISTIFSAIGIVIGGFINVVKSIISTFKETETSTNSSFSNIKNIISAILETVKGIISDITSAIKTIWKKYGDDLVNFAKTAWQGISTVISGLLNVIRGVIKTVLSLVTGDWKGAWEGIKMIVSGVWTAIKGVVTTAINAVKGVINTVLTVIKNIFTTIWGGIKNTVTSVANSIFSTVSSKFNSMKSTVSSIFNAIWSIAKSVFNNIKNAITSPVESAKTTVLNLIEKIKGAFNFRWSLPPLKLPHVSVSMRKNSWGIPYPDFNVSWYKNGGFFDQPSLIGIGEAGKEAVVPLVGRQMDPFADAVYQKLAKNFLTSSNPTNNQEIVMNNHIVFNVQDKLSNKDLDNAHKYITKQLINTMKRNHGGRF